MRYCVVSLLPLVLSLKSYLLASYYLFNVAIIALNILLLAIIISNCVY